MSKVRAPFNKYDALISKETYKPEDRDEIRWPSLNEFLFGGKPTSDFEALKDRYVSR